MATPSVLTISPVTETKMLIEISINDYARLQKLLNNYEAEKQRQRDKYAAKTTIKRRNKPCEPPIQLKVVTDSFSAKSSN
jgi:hypothetical protein